MTHRERRSYDHRVKAQIIATGNVNLFPELNIPRTTASSWIQRGLGEVVAFDETLDAESQFLDRVRDWSIASRCSQQSCDWCWHYCTYLNSSLTSSEFRTWMGSVDCSVPLSELG